jgi:hypothetical protein
MQSYSRFEYTAIIRDDFWPAIPWREGIINSLQLLFAPDENEPPWLIITTGGVSEA